MVRGGRSAKYSNKWAIFPNISEISRIYLLIRVKTVKKGPPYNDLYVLLSKIRNDYRNAQVITNSHIKINGFSGIDRYVEKFVMYSDRYVKV